MSNYWNLDNIYKGYDDKKLNDDIKFLQREIDALKHYIEENVGNIDNVKEVLATAIVKINDCEQIKQKLNVYNKLSMSVNTNDTAAHSCDYTVSCIAGELQAAVANLQKYIGKIANINEIIKSDQLLQKYEFILSEMAENEKYKCDDKTENALALMSITGSKAWQNLQNRVSSELSVDFEGESYPMTVFRNMQQGKDSDEKQKLFEIELEAYKKHETISAACINNIKGEAISIAKIRGYTSPMHKSLSDCRMESETIEALFSAIEEYAPSVREFLQIKAKSLGYNKGLPFYEIPTQMGEKSEKYTIEEAKELVTAAFYDYNKELGDLAKKAFDEDWIDFTPRAGKVYGGFCASVHSIKESRILVNFNGNFNDVITIAHELGHAYHSHLSCREEYINSRYPIPVAEIASTFAEMVLMDYIYKTQDENTKKIVMGNDITRASQLTLDILSRYYFESYVFEAREVKELNVDEIKKFMVDAQKKSFGDCLNEELLHPYAWLNKEHYYYVDRSYYNFSYAFGFLLSVGFHRMYKENKENFIKDYSAFLQNSGKLHVGDLCALMGINPNNIEFWQGAMKSLKEQIEEFKGLMGR